MKTRIATVLSLFSLLLGTFCFRDVYSKNLSQDEQLLVVGVGAFQDAFYDIAETQFKQFLKDYPNHPKAHEARYLLARIFFLKKNFQESKALFLTILNEQKRFEFTDFILYWLAEIEIRLGNPDEARRHLSSITKRFPKFDWMDSTYYLLGLLDLQLNRLSEAESSFKKVALSSKNSPLLQPSLFWLGLLAFRQKDYPVAISHFRALSGDAKSLPPRYSKYALFLLGESQLRLGKPIEAKATFRTFLDRFKNDLLVPEVQWRVAFCDYRSGSLKESVELLQTLKDQLKESPLLQSTHFLLAKIFFLNGDFSASTREINSIVYKSPDNPLVGLSFLTLFWNYVRLGDRDGATKVFQRLQKMVPFEDEKNFIQWLMAELVFYEGRIQDALPYYFNILNSRFREKALYQIGRGYFFENQFRDAITNLDILLMEFPNSGYAREALWVKAECLNRLGNVDLALNTYQLIVEEDRNDLWEACALTQIGNLRMAREEYPTAQEAFKKVMARFPNHPLSYHAACQLGNLNFRTNNLGEAIHYFSLVLRGNILELFGEAYFGLGESFYQQGKYEKAFSNFEAAIRYLSEGSLWFFLTHLELGNLQRQWGRYEEAKKAYHLILDRSKDEEIKRAAKILLNQLGTP